LAWKWQDVKTTYNGTLLDRPLVSRNRILVNLAYATRFDKWKFDLTGKWFDRSRVPTTFVDGTETRYGFYSPDYMVFNAQATRKFKKFELYAGVENIFNFIQQNQIVDAANPFGPNFDASLIWGPIMGRVVYAGFRMAIR
jgi:outer membrane receptor protein involved in Fe transport